MTNTPALTRTPLLKFAARAPFRLRQHNTGEKALQIGRGGETFYTNSDQFANRVDVPAPKQFRVLDTRGRLPCLEHAAWDSRDCTQSRGRSPPPFAARRGSGCGGKGAASSGESRWG